MVHRIVVGTLQMVGCDVIDIGLTTTPGCQLSVEHHHAAGRCHAVGEPQSRSSGTRSS
jgi:phosphomannomutase